MGFKLRLGGPLAYIACCLLALVSRVNAFVSKLIGPFVDRHDFTHAPSRVRLCLFIRIEGWSRSMPVFRWSALCCTIIVC